MDRQTVVKLRLPSRWEYRVSEYLPEEEKTMSVLTEERLNVLSEIATDCFDVDTYALTPELPDLRVPVRPVDIVRALESAYDMGLIAGYHLTRSGRTRP
jgi:hypothetical protein